MSLKKIIDYRIIKCGSSNNDLQYKNKEENKLRLIMNSYKNKITVLEAKIKDLIDPEEINECKIEMKSFSSIIKKYRKELENIDESRTNFEMNIMDLINKGFVLQGGICVSHSTFYQTLVKYEN